MSRLDQHSAFGFVIYYPIYILMTGRIMMDGLAVILIIFFSMFPDLDIFFEGFKQGSIRNLDESYQHHYTSVAHYPVVYIPTIILFIISLLLNFFPYYFIIPCIGIYLGHFLFDTIACGDGIMWTKIPWKQRYAPFINVLCGNTDGYHGLYWVARYHKTKINWIGNFLVIATILILQIFQIFYSLGSFPYMRYNPFYIATIIYLLLVYCLSKDKLAKDFLTEPPEGRYNDYRLDQDYIANLSRKNREKHLNKYGHLLEKASIKKNN